MNDIYENIFHKVKILPDPVVWQDKACFARNYHLRCCHFVTGVKFSFGIETI